MIILLAQKAHTRSFATEELLKTGWQLFGKTASPLHLRPKFTYCFAGQICSFTICYNALQQIKKGAPHENFHLITS
jgi:hypothetical protein